MGYCEKGIFNIPLRSICEEVHKMMNHLSATTIPLSTLGPGHHQYQFDLNDAFLALFDEAPVNQIQAQAQLDVEAKTNLYDLTLEIEGHVTCACDRCSTNIQLPINLTTVLYVKYKEGAPEAKTDDVLYVEPGTLQLDLSSWMYDMLILSIPIKKVYACEDEAERPCDMDVLDKLEGFQDIGEDPSSSGIWDSLRENFSN